MPKREINAREDVASSSTKKVVELKNEGVTPVTPDETTYKGLLGIVGLLIQDEKEDIKLHQERLASLKKCEKDILLKCNLVKKREILYEFTKDGESVYSTDYEEAISYADDPRTILVHTATWDEKKQKWIIAD